MTKPAETTEHYCPICGKDVADPAFKRFGEWACSEEHADEYAKEVRAKRAQAPRGPAASVGVADRDSPRHDDGYAARSSRWGWFGRRRGC